MKVTYVDHMGSDLSVVNAARVSFAKKSSLNDDLSLNEKDKNLIRYLARGMSSKELEKMVNDISSSSDKSYIRSKLWEFRRTPTHEAPFGHCFVSVHVKAPIFVARQAVKHEYLRFSEVSRRYVDSEPEFYEPLVWRFRAENVKQGSSNIGLSFNSLKEQVNMNLNEELYSSLIEKYNICPELARIVLPLSMYTEWYWSGSLDAFANMYNLRSDSHAQEEIRELAFFVSEVISPLFPESWKALTQPI